MSGTLKNSQAEFIFPAKFGDSFGVSNFNITNFKIPSISVQNIETNHLNNTGYFPGTNITFDSLNVNVMLSDDLSELKALRKWATSKTSFNFTSLFYNNLGEKTEEIIFTNALIASVSESEIDYLTEDPSSMSIDITLNYDSWDFK